MQPEPTIRCIECGGLAHALVGYEAGEGPAPGEAVPYRCEDCAERWDIVLEDDQGEGPET